MTATHWDTVCIGAGLSSLTFAALAAQKAKHRPILILDRHAVPGGYASIFSRPKAGASFECSMHKVSGAATNGGNLGRLFSELGLDHELSLRPCPDFFEVRLDGNQLVLPGDAEAFHAALLAAFPAEADGLQCFFDELFSYGRDSYFMRQILDGTHIADIARLRWAHRNLARITAAEALDQRIADPRLKQILTLPTIYVGGFAEDLGYLYYLHVFYATLVAGSAWIEGGAQRLSDALADKVEAIGGKVMLRTPALRIVPGLDGAPHRVETRDSVYTTDNLFINAAPQEALDQLMADVPGLERVRARVAAMTPAWSTTTLYLTTDRDPAELGLTVPETMILPSSDRPMTGRRQAIEAADFDPALCAKLLWHDSPLEVTNYHLLNPAAGRVVCVNALDAIGHWPERRDPAYKVRKAEASGVLLERLLADRPMLRGHVLFTELATPRTYYRFTRNTAGSGYGGIVGGGISGHNFHHNFPYKGIHFLSAWVAGSGYEAAFTYAESKIAAWLETDRATVAPRHPASACA